MQTPPGNMDMFVDLETKSEETSRSRRLSSSHRHAPHQRELSHRHLAIAGQRRFVKLQLQIVISRKLYPRVEYFNNAIQYILQMLQQEGYRIGEFLMPELQAIGKERDGDRVYRYNMLYPEDIDIQRAVALPMGGVRDPVNIPDAVGTSSDGSHSSSSTKEYLLVGAALGCVLVVVVVCVLYCRLKTEYAALAKEKVLRSGSSIIQMLKR